MLQAEEVKVTIDSQVDTTFARVIGINLFKNKTSATSKGCDFYESALFDGNAIVGLKPTSGYCAFDSGNSNSAHWKVEGGGIFSNECAFSKDNASVDLTGQCVTSVGTASGFTCSQPNQSSRAVNYPADVLDMMPSNPCDGTPGDIGLPPPASGSLFMNGVYCISNLDAYAQKDIVLNNATLYVTDPEFSLKFAGGGGLYGTPTQSGKFKNYYMVVAYNNDPCTKFSDNHAQVIEWRGNGAGTFSGTILAPAACLDLRGNADQSAIHSQVIGYIVGSNGTADVYVSYDEDENHKKPVNPSITLLK